MILVLGGEGFIGSAFVRYCRAHDLPHASVHRRNYAEWRGASCDVLINANGSSSKRLAADDPLEDFDRAVRSAAAVAADFKPSLYVFVSSGEVYGTEPLLAETDETRELLPEQQGAYGFHRRLAELCARRTAAGWLILRGGGFVGPGLSKNAICDILRGGPLWLGLDSELQYLHTDDAARLTFELVGQGISGEAVNLSARGVVRLRDVVTWARTSPTVVPGSPTQRKEMTVDELARYVAVPSTQDTVRRFVADWLAGRATGNTERTFG